MLILYRVRNKIKIQKTNMTEQFHTGPAPANLHQVGSFEPVLPVSQQSYDQINGTLTALAHIDHMRGGHSGALEHVSSSYSAALRRVNEGDESFKSALLVHAAHLMANPAAFDQGSQVLRGLQRSGISQEDVEYLRSTAHNIQEQHRVGAISHRPGAFVNEINSIISQHSRGGESVSTDRVLALQSMAAAALVGHPKYSEQYRTAIKATILERLRSNDIGTVESDGDGGSVAPETIGAKVLEVLAESGKTEEG